MKILVTGGAGFIGTHTVIELLQAGHEVIVLDNLVNSCDESVRRIKQITGKDVEYFLADLVDKPAVALIFSKNKFDCVMHLAGLKAVGESVECPLLYYSNNLIGTINLLQVMEEYGVFNILFSSSATVYGAPEYLPIDEKHPVGNCTNPYGKTKYFIEEIISDMCRADKRWNAVLLRYFNPVGAHSSGLVGEDPQGIPNNLMPFVAQVAVGKRPHLNVFGNDYETPDGTGVRDYIHVVDLAKGHLAGLKPLVEKAGLKVYNLGTGRGYSVLEMAKAVEKASGKPVPYKIAARRAGDCATVYGDVSLAARELGWKAELGLEEMCRDLWKWQSSNPDGYRLSNPTQ